MKKFKDLKVGDDVYYLELTPCEIILKKSKIRSIKLDKIWNDYYKTMGINQEETLMKTSKFDVILDKHSFNRSYFLEEDPSQGTYCTDLDAVREVFKSWIFTMDDLENKIEKLK